MKETVLLDARARYFAARNEFWAKRCGKKATKALDRAKAHLLKTTKTDSVSEALAFIKCATSGARYDRTGKRIVELRASAKGMGRLSGPPVGRMIVNNVGRGKRSR